MLLLSALSSGCTHVPPPRHPRPALPLPPHIAQRYALPGPVVEAALIPLGREDGVRFFRGRLECGAERASFHLLLPEAGTPTSLVLCLPILAGGRELMWFVATSFAARGHAVAWTDRVASALKPEQRGPELETLLRRTIVHNRMVLHWARSQPMIDPTRTAAVGISLGGMIGGALFAVEPGLRAVALCLAGGDLPGLVMVSAESRAHSWRSWRHHADGLLGAELRRELATHVLSDPALLGPYVPTSKVLLVGGLFDAVVPKRNQDVLWESLGRPERQLLPVGHYTSALAFGAIVGSIDAFLCQRFAAAPAGAAAGGE